MRSVTSAALAIAIIAALSACGDAREVVERSYLEGCGNCHSASPTSGLHDFHLNPPIAITPATCDECHPGYSIDPPAVDEATHMNGVYDAAPITTTATFTSWPTSCTDCHEPGTVPFL